MKKKLFVTSLAVKTAQDECDLGSVPPMVKRRFSPLQKVVFSLLCRTAPKGSEPKIVFASEGGEVKLTHDLVEAFNAEGEVSPWKFSSSVYNAAPGLYSVFAGNRSTYTALAAGSGTVELSLAEAVFEPGGAVWCYAEEKDGGYGMSAALENAARPDGDCTEIEIGEGDASAAEITFADAVRFFGGEIGELTGRYISLKRVG